MIRRLVLALALLPLLVSCAHDAGPFRASAHWWDKDRPVAFLIDGTMPAECLDATDEALSFWADYVDYLIPTYVGPDRIPRDREIGITYGKLGDGLAGWASSRFDRHRVRMASAAITIAVCDPLVVAHEIGHALGLSHNLPGPKGYGVPGTVMCMGLECMGWELLEEEQGWVR